MIHLARKMHPGGVARFDDLVDRLKACVRSVDGGSKGNSQFDRLELQPGYSELQHHLDRALAWAEEMQLIIREELS